MFQACIQHALGLNIRTRCAELTVLLDRASLLELHTFFPVLIDNIFGPQGTVAWGLRTITEDTTGFRELQHFLSPCGPLFKMIYTLLKDPNIKYEFPLTYMPVCNEILITTNILTLFLIKYNILHIVFCTCELKDLCCKNENDNP